MRNFRKELLEQYKSSQGIKSTSSERKLYMIDFVPWLLEMEEIGSNYTEYLKYLGLPFDAYTCAEVGKSFLDSVVKNYKTTIITPNIEEFSNIDKIKNIFEKLDNEEVLREIEKDDDDNQCNQHCQFTHIAGEHFFLLHTPMSPLLSSII